VFDVLADVAREVAGGLGVKAAASVAEVLADKSVEAVLIATPTDTHVPLIIAAAQAGKAVLCEKPIDLDMARVQACWKEIAPLNPTVMIGFNRRFDPSFRAVRERIVAGEIGTPELVLISSRDPAPPPVSYVKVSGGLFRDMTIHDFDMARYLVGDIVEVQAYGGNLVDPAIREAGDIDTAMVTMRAANGALVHINNSRRSAYGYDQRIEAFGALGMLQAANRTATTVEASNAGHSGAPRRGAELLHPALSGSLCRRGGTLRRLCAREEATARRLRRGRRGAPPRRRRTRKPAQRKNREGHTMNDATASLSPLLKTVSTTATDVWNDSCSPAELKYALANGAVGATTNPAIVLGVLAKEMPAWREWIARLVAENPTADEDTLAWKLIEQTGLRGAELLLPVFEREKQRKGRLSIQTNPIFYRNTEALVAQAVHFAALAPNIQVKIPATAAGIPAIEEATYRG